MIGNILIVLFCFFLCDCRVASGSGTAHDPARRGRHHKDRRGLEETEHAGPLSGTTIIKQQQKKHC